MAGQNRFINTAKVASLALPVLENELIFVKNMNRQYSEEFAQKESGAIGYTVNIKKPPRYEVGDGPVIDTQATISTYVPLTMRYQKHVAVQITAADYTLSDDNFQETVLQPIMAQLANKVERTAFEYITPKVANFVVPDGGLGSIDGRTSTAAQAIGTVGTADQILTEMSAPETERAAIIAPRSNTGLVVAYSSLFNPQNDGGRRFNEGTIGRALNFDFGRSVNVITQQNGTLNTTGATGASAQAGYTGEVQPNTDTPFNLTIAALSATMKVGQRFTIAGVYAVNPLTRESLGRLQTFVVRGNGTLGQDVGATDTTVQISPYPIFKGPFKNVHSSTDNIPGSSTITSVSGLNSSSYTNNLFFHPNFATMATARLMTPSDYDASFKYSQKLGLGIRFIKNWYDVNTDRFITRFDILFGFEVVYPELATVVSG